jgi:CNT family concentrative nucleoside transporter
MSKLIVPETGEPVTLGISVKPHYEREDNIIMAIINGAWSGLRLLGGIFTLLIAFLGIMALIDLVLGGAGGYLNQWFGLNVEWSLSGLLGYVFYPFALLLGVPPADATEVARLLGQRPIVTELAAYRELAVLLENGDLIHPRSAIIASYALCGFAHVASLAIFVGGISALAPERVKDLSRLGFRALLAATLACLMTGAVAGVFYTSGSILLGR